MRRDGDRLLAHLGGACSRVLLCAPFIKVGVLNNLLRVVPIHVEIEVVTRWLPAEVAVGVSDLEIFELLGARRGATLKLLDRLHAKIYLSDGNALVGSANLTGPALGWSSKANLELLVELDRADAALQACLSQLNEARIATVAERDRVRELASLLKVPRLDLVADVELATAPGLWLPKLAAPQRLFQAYTPRTRDRLSESVLEAALADLDALAIPSGLTDVAFKSTVAAAFRGMPAINRILRAAAEDLKDAAGIELISDMAIDDGVPPETRWLIVREWLTYFLGDAYEIAPQNFVLRLKPGAGRP